MEEMSKAKQVHFLPLARLFLLVSVGKTEHLTQMPDTNAWKHGFPFNEETQRIRDDNIFLIVISYLDVIYHIKLVGEIPTYTLVL